MTLKNLVACVVVSMVLGCGPNGGQVVPSNTVNVVDVNGWLQLSVPVELIGDGTWDPDGYVQLIPRAGSATALHLDPSILAVHEGISSGSYVLHGQVAATAFPPGPSPEATITARFTYWGGALRFTDIDSDITAVHFKR